MVTRGTCLALVLLAGCTDPAQAITDASSGSASNSDSPSSSTAPSTAPTSGTADTTNGSSSSTGPPPTTDTTTDNPTTTDESSSSTGTPPPHITDFGRCDITVSCADAIIDEPKRTCSLTIAEADGYVVYDGFAGFENRGRSSQGWPKHQYSVELWQTPSIEFVAPGSSWRYNDTGTSGGIGWNTPGFDDTGWAQGPTPIGYGVLGPQWQRDGMPWATSAQIPNATTASFGPNPGDKHITSWYRREFQVANAAALSEVVLNIRADDGGVVYINGSEAARFNMPEGPITQATLAAASLESLGEVEFLEAPVSPALFVDGTNLVAVEVHQFAQNSSDTVLDLALSTKPAQAPANFFEFGTESDWILNGMYFDLSLYRNKLMYDLFHAFDPEANYAPEGHYCDLTLDGDWRGVYTLGEKIKRDDDRVAIAPQADTGDSFIFKSDITKTWITTNGVRWQLVYPKPHNVIEASAAGLNSFMSGFANANAGAGNPWDYVDMPSIVDWVLLQEFAGNGDGYSSSMHIYKDIGGKIKFAPWDFDIGLAGGCSDTEGWLPRQNGHWLNGMAADPVFQAALVARWAELRESVLSQEAIAERVDGFVETITPETIAENFERWPQSEIIGGDDWVLIFRENCPVDTWEEEHAVVQQWISDRLLWMDANIADYN